MKPDECKFFDYLVTFVFVASCLRYGLEDLSTGNPPKLEKGHIIVFDSLPHASGEALSFQLYDLMKSVSNNKWPKTIVYEKLSKEKNLKFRKQLSVNTPVYKGVVIERIQMSLIQPLFVFYYETIKDDIKRKYGEKKDRPDCLNFGYVIRNTFSHGGKIWFKNLEAAPVKWKGLTYSPKDNGKEIFLKDLAVGDILSLMIEMDELL